MTRVLFGSLLLLSLLALGVYSSADTSEWEKLNSKVFGLSHWELRSAYNRLATVYRNSGREQEASQVEKRLAALGS